MRPEDLCRELQEELYSLLYDGGYSNVVLRETDDGYTFVFNVHSSYSYSTHVTKGHFDNLIEALLEDQYVKEAQLKWTLERG